MARCALRSDEAKPGFSPIGRRGADMAANLAPACAPLQALGYAHHPAHAPGLHQARGNSRCSAARDVPPVTFKAKTASNAFWISARSYCFGSFVVITRVATPHPFMRPRCLRQPKNPNTADSSPSAHGASTGMATAPPPTGPAANAKGSLMRPGVASESPAPLSVMV